MIKTGEMLAFTKRLNEIRKVKDSELKLTQLINLQFDIQTKYGAKALHNDLYVSRLYRTVADEVFAL